MNKLNKKGFTLIEMLVVIAIIAVLVSIIVPVVGNSTAKAKAATDAANLRSIAATAAIDYLDNSKLDNTYDLPACKSDSTGAMEIHMVNNEIIAVFKIGTKYCGVDYFAKMAETGTANGSEESGLSSDGTSATKMTYTVKQ